MSRHDPVNHPKHYTQHPSGVECIAVTEHMNFCLGNAVKYIWRADEKGNAIEDLKKARWYLDREIRRLTGESQVEEEPIRQIQSPPPFEAPDEGSGSLDFDHTPGPWTVCVHEDLDVTSVMVKANTRSICDIIDDMPVDIANARLIAAAPEMLRVLKEIQCWSEYQDLMKSKNEPSIPGYHFRIQVSVAIRKALGQIPTA